MSSRERLDDLRARYPDMGFAIYALEPGGAVTLEVHAPDGRLYSWKGGSAAEVLDAAFPPADVDTVIAAEGIAPGDDPEADQPSLFD